MIQKCTRLKSACDVKICFYYGIHGNLFRARFHSCPFPGEYTCTAINSLGECSTSALLLGPDRYQAWLAEQGKGPAAVPSPRLVQLESPIPKRPDSFYRPVAEKVLDVTSEAPLSDYEDPDKVPKGETIQFVPNS